MTNVISETRFAELAATHGADFAHWPAEARVGAEALARVSPAAQAALAEARALDEILADLAAEPVAAPSAALTARVLEGAAEIRPAPAPRPAPPPVKGFKDWLFGGFGSAAACASAAAFGLWLGYAGPIAVADAAQAFGVEDEAFVIISDSPFLDGIDEEGAE